MENNESRETVRRYIRLIELQSELQQMVDEKKIAKTTAVEISYLKQNEQKMLLDTIASEQATPSLSQTQRMKKLSQSGELTDDSMLKIMSEQKKPGLHRPVEQYYETQHKTDFSQNAENAALSKFCVNTKFQSTKLQT